MCLICDKTENITKISTVCEKVKHIPNIKGLKYLEVTENIETIESMDDLEELVCMSGYITHLPTMKNLKEIELYCVSIKKIDWQPKLECLQISICDDLKSIPYIESITDLQISGCSALTKIPKLPNLINLSCNANPRITEIPYIKGLQTLMCHSCDMLTYIPKIDNLRATGYPLDEYVTDYETILKNISAEGCPWLKPSEDRLNKLIKLQKWVKRLQLSKKLETIIPDIVKIYYTPGMKGYKLAESRFNS